MFIGKYQNSIDDKSRMIVPSKFREELGAKCVLTKGFDKCLYVYTEDAWEKFASKLVGLKENDFGSRRLSRHFSTSATNCCIDKQGRLTIPQELREYANIEKELITAGIMDKFEIWSKSEWDKEGNDLDPEEVAKGMEVYGI